MTSVADILVRVNALNAKYGHYASEDAGAARRAKGDDPFEHTYRQLLGEVEARQDRGTWGSRRAPARTASCRSLRRCRACDGERRDPARQAEPAR